MYLIVRTLAFVLIPVSFILGCGDKRGETASADSAAPAATDADPAESATPATTATAGTSADESSRPVTVEDIDRWQRGMTAELEAVQAKLKTAKTDEEKMSLMMEVHEQTTAPVGAKAAGLDQTRYEFVRAKLSDAVKWLAPLEFGQDKSQMPKETEATRADREAYFKQMAWAVPPDVVEALKPRAAELSKQEWRLTAARLGK